MKLLQRTDVVLPTDIIYLIFEHLASSFPAEVYDPITMTTCELLYTPGEIASKRCFTSLSLVCRSWGVMANARIVQVLAIRIYNTLRAPLDWLASHPSLTPHVHHLRLVTSIDHDTGSDEDLHSPGFDPLELRYLLTRFPKLRVLELVDIPFLPGPPTVCIHPHDGDQSGEELIERDESYPSLRLEHFAFYDTGRFELSPDSMSLCLDWLEDIGSILVAIRSEDLRLRWASAFDIARKATLIFTRHGLFLNHSELGYSVSPLFQTDLPKKLYVEVGSFTITELRDFLCLASRSINELSLDFVECFGRTAVFTMPVEAPVLGEFVSLSALTIKLTRPNPNSTRRHEIVLRNILLQFLSLSSLRSFTMVIIGNFKFRTPSRSSMQRWTHESFSQLADWLALALGHPIISHGLLSLDHISLYSEDACGSKVPFSLEQQDCFRDMFARVDAVDLLRF